MSGADVVEIVAGVPLIVVIPAIVEVAKQNGLPVRYAGIAAMVSAFVMIVLADLAINGAPGASEVVRIGATWAVMAVVYGLAAAGLYSQTKAASSS